MLTQTEVKRWSKKEAFEKTNASEKRMREKHIYYKEIETELVNKAVSFYIDSVDWGRGIALGEYDADNEYFILNSEKFGELMLNVAIK
ncbi:MAG: hypothetical protein KTR30_26650 [Saprospiraceae bacterium]|nr:hypothetical protein [Saprospiraceae bacterium]